MTTAATVPAESLSGSRSRSDALPRWAFPAILAAPILAYWLPRLTRGFWIDEATTYWIDQGGWSQAWIKLTSEPGQSILYQYLVLPFMSDGSGKELLLRIPSVVGMLAAIWVLYKLTERIAGPGAGWLASVAFACCGAIIETATNARPYALGLAVILTSFWSLVEWVRSPERKWLATYLIASVLVVYFHYLFGVIFVAQAAYLVAAGRDGKSFSWPAIVASGGAIASSAVPLAWRVLTLAHQARTWTSAVKPTAGAFLSLFPWQAIIAATVGLILFFALHPEWFSAWQRLPARETVLLTTWLLAGPIVMFAAQSTTGLAVFATRYLIYALPPCFILLAWCVRHVSNQGGRLALSVAMVLSGALYVSDIGSNTPEWRTPLWVAQEMAGRGTPVILRCAHADGVGLNWRTEPNPANHYFAQLAPYPMQNEIIPAPFFVDAAAVEHLEHEIERRTPSQRRFCLVADKGADILNILAPWFLARGYRVKERDVSGIEVVLFER